MSRGVRPPLFQAAASQVLLPSVLSTLSSPKTREAYRTAILDFLTWFGFSAKPLVKSTVEAWRATLVQRGLAPSSINQRLSAVRLLFRHAQEHQVIGAELAAQLKGVRNVSPEARKVGHWLTAEEAGQLLSVPDSRTLLGKRDRSMLALLIACGLRRDEVVHLACDHLRQREGRWVLWHFAGKGQSRRTVALPGWVKEWLDQWLTAAAIRKGILFRRLRTNGELDPDGAPLGDDSVYLLVKRAGAAIGKPALTPHDLRRTCAQLCRQAGGALEQIQFLLGHASIQTTERYLGSKQELGRAVNDQITIKAKSARSPKSK